MNKTPLPISLKSTLVGDIFITIAQLLTIIYSFFLFFLAILTTTGIPGFGDLPPTKIRPETLIVGIVAVFYLLYPIWLFKIKARDKLPKWSEYLITLMLFSPLIIWVILSFTP